MPKIITILLIILVSQLTPIVKQVYALESCTSSNVQISYKNSANGTTNENTFWLADSKSFILTFTINNSTMFNNLKDKGMRLLVDNLWTPNVNIQNQTFDISLSGDQIKENPHNGILQWVPPGASDWQDFCSNVVYKVGIKGACQIYGIPEKIPPYSSLTVKFLGAAGIDYQLRTKNNILSDTIIGQTTTKSNNQGTFSPIIITGSNNDKVKLTLYPLPFGRGDLKQCDKEITLDSKVAPQPAPSDVVAPAPKKCGDKDEKGNVIVCGNAGGDPCDVDKQKRGPGIKTAIGCIHTNPAEFVKDIMTFIIGIGGGLAFLMMLLGAFQMLTSAGNPETLNAGRERLTSAVIGLLFIIFAVLFLQIIGVDILNIPGFSR